MEQLKITSATPNSALLDLPWRLPLIDWPSDVLAALPRGISRHVVRFVRLDGRVLAIKEISQDVAFREYGMLRQLRKLEIPSVRPVGVVTGRTSDSGEPLEAALVTEHLAFSLPYRSVFSQWLRDETANRLIDALAVLIVRLHLAGFFWGDVSLSNTLFRRDAEQFAAYLVDAETGALHRELTRGQREHDLEIARVNIIGELMDLAAGELLDSEIDEVAFGNSLVDRYRDLWEALTGVEAFASDERWRVAARIERLNALGFDVGELDITTDIDGTTVRIQPQVVDAGHHSRRLLKLTGLDVQDNQARRLLNDLDSYQAATDRQEDDPQLVAHDWLQNVFHPTVRAVPRELRRKLEPAQLYHEILDHRWFISEQSGHDVPMPETVASYVKNVLRYRPDEKAILGMEPGDEPEGPEADYFHYAAAEPGDRD
ncbi:DUF4032 domain-containing protein [Isoptericola sp. AK164]|uniref:DUF4032 domain-containing protein n=1 Tax=Isoptericola sp. AK164 TaxID=3024246 RepID=UPI002418A9E3|nr:DUF4032 domain-containing protein [Isoptericola sp. AK164]